jgi:hypothetical protein
VHQRNARGRRRRGHGRQSKWSARRSAVAAVCYEWSVFSRRIAAALACTLLIGAPATAFAQSAGDQQYFDPVGGDDGGGSSGSGGSDSGGGSTPAPQPSTGTSAAPAPAPSSTATPAASSPSTTAAAPAGELPRTGGEPFLIATFGVAMLLTGAGMRLLVVPETD